MRTGRWIWVAVKVAVAAGIIAWMWWKGLIRVADLSAAAGRWPLLVAAVAFVLVGMFLATIRWEILLRAQGVRMGIADLFRLTMTGFFFSVVSPGGLGGDAVKAWYVARGRGTGEAAAVATTVFLDRLLGLVTLFVVAGVIVLLDFERLWNLEVKGVSPLGLPFGRALVILIGGCLAGAFAFGLVVTSKRVRGWLAGSGVSRVIPFRHVVKAVYEAMHVYGGRPGAVLKAGLVSLAAQVPLYVIYWLYAEAAGVRLSMWDCALIVPPALLIRTVPLVPGGAGQGMVAMSLLFPLVGVAASKGATVGAIGDAIFMLVFLLGGLFFLFGKDRYAGLAAGGGAAGPEAR